jgi:hypothetical protein
VRPHSTFLYSTLLNASFAALPTLGRDFELVTMMVVVVVMINFVRRHASLFIVPSATMHDDLSCFRA